jgi:hypothetical protein
VSVYLATLADAAPMQRCPGVSARALRSALRMMCRIAQGDGTMRYGLRASKLAKLCDYSTATIHRAERQLVELGYVERVQVGGGRTSTRWRVVIEKLLPADASTPPPQAAEPAVPSPRRPFRPWSITRRPPQSTIVTSVCSEHGGDGGTLADGSPRCPQCRRESRPRPP